VLTSLDKYENQRVLVTGRLDGDGGAKGINVNTVTSQEQLANRRAGLRWRLRRRQSASAPGAR
jgi:hypothetical protein